VDKKKILIIDDEVDFTKALKLNLDSCGKYEVLTENNASNALACVRSFKPDLVLLDIMMPDIDGGEVAYRIESDESIGYTPIVFLTAAVTKEEVTSSRKSTIGGHVFIAKPVSLEDLLVCIEANIR